MHGERIAAFLCAMVLLAPAPSAAERLPADDRRMACSIYAPGVVISALQHGDSDEGTAALLQDNLQAVDWPAAYARFVRSGAPMRLRAFADRQAARHGKRPRYPVALCRDLTPILAAADTLNIVSANGVKIGTSPLLVRCPTGRCVAPAIAAIADTCDFQPFSIPVKPICR
jgi:hypothetical protein